jgi:polysaccharide export outer membrane protein
MWEWDKRSSALLNFCTMRTAIFHVLTVIFLVALIPACKVQKMNINYLSDIRDTSHGRIWQSYDVKIQPGDKLQIGVLALNPASVQPYSLGQNGTPGVATVGADGNILYPQLGLIKAAGLTRLELRDVLLEKLKVYLKDPVVTLDFANFKVTMLGEIKQQGALNVPEGKITILEAIGQAGDITETGRRDSILVIREINGRREFGNVNLLSNEVFKSPYFVLQQNDIVYVPMVPSKALVAVKERKGVQLSSIYSVLGILSTLTILIMQLTR